MQKEERIQLDQQHSDFIASLPSLSIRKCCDVCSAPQNDEIFAVIFWWLFCETCSKTCDLHFAIRKRGDFLQLLVFGGIILVQVCQSILTFAPELLPRLVQPHTTKVAPAIHRSRRPKRSCFKAGRSDVSFGRSRDSDHAPL